MASKVKNITKTSKKKKKTSKKSSKKKVKRKPDLSIADLKLPTEKKEVSTDLRDYTLLVYGREKIGKTTFFSTFPDCLFFCTEPGSKGLHIFDFNSDHGGCKNWDIVRKGVQLLEKHPTRFKNVCFDTVDRAYDMCLDWICKKRGIEYPGQDEYGREDFGKSWRAVKQEFIDIIHRILQLGMGLCFTSHAVESQVESRSGNKYTRIHPSMSNQGRKVIEALVDLFFYADYMRSPDGGTQRVLVTEGDEVIWAGQREVGVPLPRLIPLTAKGGYDILAAAFKGEDVGLDPQTLIPTNTATDTIAKFYRDVRTQAAKKGGRKKKKKKKKSRK